MHRQFLHTDVTVQLKMIAISCILANNISNDDPLCWRLLADCHLKLCAFTLAEYYYRKAQRLRMNFLESLIEQNSPDKCEEVLQMIPSFESDTSLTELEKTSLIQISAR